MCGVPSVISAVLMIIFIPESPKFTYAQGDEIRTLNILKRIYTCNTGRADFKVTSLIKDKEFEDASNPRNCSFFKFMWSQTAPLFRHPHLRNMMTACFLQFGICVACNGFWTFFPEIVNKVSIWLESDPSHTTATVCEIISSSNFTTEAETSMDVVPTTCVTKLELDTFYNVIMLTLLYSVLWLIISVVINRTGKLVIIALVMFGSGSASILLMFIELPQVSLFIYLVLLLAGLNMSVVNSSTVELFPTTLRAMAVSISMMMGRFGSVFGSNLVGILIKSFCFYTWIVPAVLLISGGFLAFTIPNIGKRHKK
jgi:VNT family MFS transporter (synaptic vesicle glycoprotein 2)